MTIQKHALRDTSGAGSRRRKAVPLMTDWTRDGKGCGMEYVGTAGDDTLIGRDREIDVLRGLEGNDYLDGGGGFPLNPDDLFGGPGNDVLVSRAGTRGPQGRLDVNENPDEGNDKMLSLLPGEARLPDNIEQLVLLPGSGGAFTGTDYAYTGGVGTGNSLDNIIVGNAGANELRGLNGDDVLDGGGGGDRLEGGVGNDQYLIRGGEILIERPGEGNDKVLSFLSEYALVDEFEQLVLQTGAVVGRGNNLNNIISGSSGDNTLYGLSGFDLILGGPGNDEMTGGSESDVFIFEVGFGFDKINDFAPGAGSEDVIRFGSGLFSGFDDVMARSQQLGPDVAIILDDQNTIRLVGVNLTDLSTDDFIFG